MMKTRRGKQKNAEASIDQQVVEPEADDNRNVLQNSPEGRLAPEQDDHANDDKSDDDNDGEVSVRAIQNEEEVTPPPSLPPLRLRPSIPSSSFCFVCVNDLQMEKRPAVTQSDCFLLLTYMLELTGTESNHYLDQLGEPDKWIGLCFKCHDLIKEAAKVRGQIAKLQHQLENCQRQVVEKIRSTKLAAKTRGTQQKPCPKRKQRIAVEAILEIVHARNYSAVPSSRKRGHQSDDMDDKQELQTGPSSTKKCNAGHAKKAYLSKAISLPPSTVGTADFSDEEQLDPDPLTFFEGPEIKIEFVNDNDDYDDDHQPEAEPPQIDTTFSVKLKRIQLPQMPPRMIMISSKTDRELIHYYPCDLCCDDAIYTTQEELALHHQTIHHQEPNPASSTTVRKRRPTTTANKRKEPLPSASSSSSSDSEAVSPDNEGSDPDYNQEIPDKEDQVISSSSVAHKKRRRKVGRPRRQRPESESEEGSELDEDSEKEKGEEEGSKSNAIPKRRRGRASMFSPDASCKFEVEGERKGYDCPTCPAVKNYELNRFVQHLAIHQRNPFKCAECLAFLPDDEFLQERHWMERHPSIELPSTSSHHHHHPPEKFIKVPLDRGEMWKCDGCPSGFVSEEARALHEKSCPDSRSSSSKSDSSYSCSTCNSIFRSIEEWRLHRALNHPGIDRLSCLYCDESFGELTKQGEEHRHDVKMRAHIMKEHPQIKPYLARIFPECESCGEVFWGEEETKLHFQKTHHQAPDDGNPIFFCKICSAGFPNKSALGWHVKAHFPKYAAASATKATIPCDSCGSTFQKNRLLQEHQLVEHGVKPPNGIPVLSCSVEGCGFQSTFDKGLNRHAHEVHLDRRAYDCPSCPAVKDYDLNRFAQHLAIHQRNPWKCSECSAFLPDNEDLHDQHWKKEHSNNDDLDIPDKFVKVTPDPGEIWKCEGCSAGYASEEVRDTHEQSCSEYLSKKTSTSKASPTYPCAICKYASRNADEWRLHRVLQHPEIDRLSCLYCDQSLAAFLTKEGVEHRYDSKMRAHIRKEHKGCLGRIFNECQPCALVFWDEKETVEHFRKIHQLPDGGGGSIFFCHICPSSFDNKVSLMKHIRFSHFSGVTINPRSKAAFPCDLCEEGGKRSFSEAKMLYEHQLLQHGIQPPEGIQLLTCPVVGCGFQSTFKRGLHSHSEEVHGAPRKSYPQLRANPEERRCPKKRPRSILDASPTCDICGLTLANSLNRFEHQLNKHGIRIPEESNPMTCPVEGCDFQTFVIDKLRSHSHKVHGVPRKFICGYCGKGYLTNSDLRIHERGHQNQESKPYQCDICGKPFPLRKNLNSHKRWKHKEPGKKNLPKNGTQQQMTPPEGHPEGVNVNTAPAPSRYSYSMDTSTETLTCGKCPSTFDNFPKFSRHYEATHLELRFKCSVCGKVCPSRSSCHAHLRAYHRDVEDRKVEAVPNNSEVEVTPRKKVGGHEIPAPLKSSGRPLSWTGKFEKDPESGRSRCLLCMKDYSNLPNFRIHFRRIHREERFGCPDCGKEFSKNQEYELHYLKSHKGVEQAKKATDRYDCDLCDKTYTSQLGLKGHQKSVHLGERERHVCEQCGRLFTTSRSLKIHVKLVHLEERNFGCDFCGERFKRNNDLKIHQRKVHHNGSEEEVKREPPVPSSIDDGQRSSAGEEF